EEIWRVICHELAINIWEHSHRAGFICARVVEFPYLHRKLRPWCAYAYSNITEALERWSSKGFLELTVVDCGDGFLNTLKTAYLERSGLPEEQVRPENILCFAFDEFGTSKSQNESWATERHALGRILQI